MAQTISANGCATGEAEAYRQATPEERVAFATAIEPQLLFDNVVVPAVG